MLFRSIPANSNFTTISIEVIFSPFASKVTLNPWYLTEFEDPNPEKFHFNDDVIIQSSSEANGPINYSPVEYLVLELIYSPIDSMNPKYCRIKIDQEEAILRQKSEFGEIYNLTIELLQKFIPQKKVEVCENVIIKVDDFTLGPCITELESIGMIRQVAGWTVDVAVNYDSPSACGGYDVDIVDLGEFRNGKEAVIALIRSLLGAEVEKYIEKKYEEEMTKYIFSDLPF